MTLLALARSPLYCVRVQDEADSSLASPPQAQSRPTHLILPTAYEVDFIISPLYM